MRPTALVPPRTALTLHTTWLEAVETVAAENWIVPPTTTDGASGETETEAGTLKASALAAAPERLRTTKRPVDAPSGTAMVRLVGVAAVTSAGTPPSSTWLLAGAPASKPPPASVTSV